MSAGPISSTQPNGVVTLGNFLLSCAEMREQIKLLFGEVSGAGPGIDAQNGSRRALRERGRFWVVCPHWPIGFNGVLCNNNVFDSCIKS